MICHFCNLNLNYYDNNEFLEDSIIYACPSSHAVITKKNDIIIRYDLAFVDDQTTNFKWITAIKYDQKSYVKIHNEYLKFKTIKYDFYMEFDIINDKINIDNLLSKIFKLNLLS